MNLFLQSDDLWGNVLLVQVDSTPYSLQYFYYVATCMDTNAKMLQLHCLEHLHAMDLLFVPQITKYLTRGSKALE